MLSKYLRETLMTRFNAYWQTHLPDVMPTAGYYGDGTRSSPTSSTSAASWGSPITS